MIARVTLDLALGKEFDYRIPEELAGRIEVGTRVKVPFGKRDVLGCVTALVESSPHPNLREVIQAIGRQSHVSPVILRLARWMSQYYCCVPEAALKTVLPEAVRKEKEGWREQLFVRALPEAATPPKLTRRQEQTLEHARTRKELSLQELLDVSGASAATVRRLEDKGLVAIAAKISERDPYAREVILPSAPLPLNADQAKALAEVADALHESSANALGGTGVAPKPPCAPVRPINETPAPAAALFTKRAYAPVTETTARRRLLPHFEIPGKIYHVSWKTHDKLALSGAAQEKALAACRFWHGKKMTCLLACVMPNHVHLLIQPLPIQEPGSQGVYPLSEILHSIKSFSAHEINEVMRRESGVWQNESFDRMIRSETDLHEKWDYIWNNPRTEGLAGPMEDYSYIWFPGIERGCAENLIESATAHGDFGETPKSTGQRPVPPGDSGANALGGTGVPPKPPIPPELKTQAPSSSPSSPSSGPRPKSRVFLLHGVTGSGKTEVYLQAIAMALLQGKGAIVLVPEISLTPQTVERFKARFSAGDCQTLVAVLHSHLSDGERHDEWHKIRQGRARIVIGARSAVFAPVERLGLIIVDEEHEYSYKQEEAPRYHARDVAVVRAQMEEAVVVLGSATPSLESFYNTQKGKYRLLELPTRADDKKMPIVRVVDMRQVARKERGTPIFSPLLKEAIHRRLDRNEQTFLFINRRGFATSMQCPLCGYVAKCPDCSVSLTYHRPEQTLRCHICDHRAPAPKVCPDAKCRNPAIRYAGIGTQRVESVLATLFPKARIRRMDSDALKRKEDYRRILGDVRTGKVDILVGTQMIAKGLHFPNVTLVGIIHADLSLHMPDFRAGERTFQLLTQVAGRAGRGDVEGEVVVQAFTPFHPAIQFARRHDFNGFYEQEMDFRGQLSYPPLTRLVSLLLKGANEDKVKFSSDFVKAELAKKSTAIRDLLVAGPAPAPLARAKKDYRYQIMLRARQIAPLAQAVTQLQADLNLPDGVSMSVDVDPVNLM